RLVAEAELPERGAQLSHQLVDACVDALPTLLQEKIRGAAEELQVVLEYAVAVHELFRSRAEMLIGLDAGCVSHLGQQQMRQIEHLLAARRCYQRILVLWKGAAVWRVERIADRQPQDLPTREIQT